MGVIPTRFLVSTLGLRTTKRRQLIAAKPISSGLGAKKNVPNCIQSNLQPFSLRL